MNLNKTLVIYDSIPYFIPFMKKKGIKCFSSFKKVSSIERILRMISFKTGLKKNIWYGEWKKHAYLDETVIIFATNRYDFIEYLADNYPHLRIIVWYWNPVFRCFEPDKLNKKNIEYWSFDEEDCKKYNLKFNTTFYLNNIEIDNNSIKEYDVLFLGADKKRKILLDKINNDLIAANIKTLFHIVPDKGQPNPQNIKPLLYSDYLKLVSQSKCIFDYIQKGQSGNTVRTMESIFFRKKLITNDINIQKELFYDPANIFILEYDDFNTIDEFINTPFKELKSEIVDYFDFSNWLNRFTKYE
ncbi:hypothetical protein SAMN05421846_10287 [Chryseobacterium taeanense]|uniref:Uncharacterized protein n=1 Tax=Chryseobacterium taeanense TaxID=311334 RepID=A0A1G8FC76_9FLAO|nr:hypothetical protein [Chryseobacterium taeanense]SDH79764.1 hypothetical protein SAMN05421846_10287 [Chryseobacterium taeanense]